MKKILTFLSLALFVSGSMSYAATNESGSVKFPDSVRVGSKVLPAGTYALHWEAGSSNTELKISGHGQEVSVPATVAATAGRDEVLTHRDGTTEVVEGFTVKSTSFTIK